MQLNRYYMVTNKVPSLALPPIASFLTIISKSYSCQSFAGIMHPGKIPTYCSIYFNWKEFIPVNCSASQNFSFVVWRWGERWWGWSWVFNLTVWGFLDFNSKLTSYKKQQKFTSIKFDVIRNHTLTTPENYTTTIPYAIPDATDKIAIFWKINNPLKSNLKSTKFFAMSLTRNKFLYLKGKQCFALKRFRLWCFQCFTIFKIYVTTDITVYKKLHFRLY